MGFTGFETSDFEVFEIEGLEARMNALRTKIQPKFAALGEHFAPFLTEITGEEMHTHIARHARRTVNPPASSWVAFASNKKGYKKWPHFQIGLWDSHVFAWLAIMNEAERKKDYAEQLLKKRTEIKTRIPNGFIWSDDHTKREATLHTNTDIEQLLTRLKNVKKAELLCGIHISKEDPLVRDGKALIRRFEETFQTVLPFYQTAKKAYSLQ